MKSYFSFFLLLMISFTLLACGGNEEGLGNIDEYLVEPHSSEAIDVVNHINELFLESDYLSYPTILSGDEKVSSLSLSSFYGKMLDMDFYISESGGLIEVSYFDIDALEQRKEDHSPLETVETNSGNYSYTQDDDKHIILGENGQFGVELSSTDEHITKETLVSLVNSLELQENGGVNLYPIPKKLDFSNIVFPAFSNEMVRLGSTSFDVSGDIESLDIFFSFSDIDGILNYIVDTRTIDVNEKDEFEIENNISVFYSGSENFDNYEWQLNGYRYMIRVGTDMNVNQENLIAIINNGISSGPVVSVPERLTEAPVFVSGDRSEVAMEVNASIEASEEAAEEEARKEEEERESEREEQRAQEEAEKFAEVKEEALEEYSDHLRLGETYSWVDESDPFVKVNMDTTVKSFELLEEINGIEPRSDYFLAVEVNLDNKRAGNYSTEGFVRGIVVNDFYNSSRRLVRSDEEPLGDYPGKLPEDIEEYDEIEGVILFDVSVSNYYRLSLLEGDWILFMDEETKGE